MKIRKKRNVCPTLRKLVEDSAKVQRMRDNEQGRHYELATKQAFRRTKGIVAGQKFWRKERHHRHIHGHRHCIEREGHNGWREMTVLCLLLTRSFPRSSSRQSLEVHEAKKDQALRFCPSIAIVAGSTVIYNEQPKTMKLQVQARGVLPINRHEAEFFCLRRIKESPSRCVKETSRRQA